MLWNNRIRLVLLCACFCSVVLGVPFKASVYGQLGIQFEPIPASLPINSPNAVMALDVVYDDLDPNRQAFHIFLPSAEGTFPLVIFYHGGGFTGGSRDTIFVKPDLQRRIEFFLGNGIAFASIGYRLIETDVADDAGVIKCLGDSKRALQFIRYHANELHIAPERVALSGSSAGAGTALWLATRSEMADPTAKDPVFRESTRVRAVEVGGTQATYDLADWESVVYADFGTTVEEMIELLGFDRLSNFYGGVDSIDQIYVDPDLIQYRQDVDMLFHMSDDDPPLYIHSRSTASIPTEDLFHHGAQSVAVQTTALNANVSEVKARIRFMDIDTTDNECGSAFLARYLGVDTGLKGDVNEDGWVNLLDVAPFVNILTGAAPFNSNADITCDGSVNLLDVGGFIGLLSH